MKAAVQIVGLNALERMAEAPQFNQWMYTTIAPYLNGNILEIGSGIGNLSSFFIADGKHITLSDYDLEYVTLLKEKFRKHKVADIYQLDLAQPDFTFQFAHLANSFDSVFLLNVLEHIADDYLAVQYCRFLLKPGGRLIILVPSYSFLFSKMDRLLGHYRRYTKASLKKVIIGNNLEVCKTFYFNFLGMAGWWWNKIFDKAEISETKMNLFNRLVPLAKLLDKITLQQAGLSTIIVAQKPENGT